jgi:ribonucrease Y
VEWVVLVGLGAAFVLGLLFLDAYRKRSSPAGPRRTAAAGAGAAAGSPAPVVAPETESDDPQNWARAARRLAETEAESIRALARREADSARREAAAEAAALLRSARAEAAEARVAAEAGLADQRRAIEEDRSELLADRTKHRSESELATAALAKERAELAEAEDRVRRRLAETAARETEMAGRQAELDARARDIEALDAELAGQDERRLAELSRIAGLSEADAQAELMTEVEARSRREAATLARGIESEARAAATTRARAIVVDAVQRVASEQTTESVVSVLHLPSDEMKGRIIGREGRNIRAFESITGVNVIIDDTPEAVLLSCFDPVRRETGRLTLERLVLDGRIHPQRIEEVYDASRNEVDSLCLRAATDALAEVGVGDVDERLLPTLGRLRYRTSYGQNVLAHLVETAHIAALMAAELGFSKPEATVVKRAAFLHDIGKALTHEVEGSHAIVGAELLRSFGEDERVVHAVEAHHNEVAPHSVEAVLTQAADACSAARPGARRESLESYVKRLERIEAIASAREGVERVYAMQAGREVRVMVRPESVDDLESAVIAREVAKQIEDELTYPGQIRVTVVRETRATEVAH